MRRSVVTYLVRVIEMVQEYRQEQYVISTDPTKLDLEVIFNFLTHSYWAKGISREKVRTCIEHSLCFGVYEKDEQIGFARVITDYARIAHLADVFILEPYRGRGLGKWLMQCIMQHPDLQGLSKWTLATKDAHELYRQFGFKPLQFPETYMEFVRSKRFNNNDEE